MKVMGLLAAGALIAFLFLASACGGGGEIAPTSAATATSTPSVVPTLTPTSPPVATPTKAAAPLKTTEPSKDLVALGRELYLNVPLNAAPQALWCYQCHKIESIPQAAGLIGPDHTHLATWAADRRPGYRAEEYIRESVVDPTAFVAEGVERSTLGLMTEAITEKLTGEQVDALVAFLLTLK